MNTKPDAFQPQKIVPAQVQCPRCGAYTPKQTISYRNPQTWEQKDDKGLPGCLIMIVGFLVVGIVVELVVAGLLYLTGLMNDPLYGDVGLIGYPFAFAGAVAAIPIYREWRRNRLRKTHTTIRRFECWQCKNEWTVTQEPTAKKSS